MKEFLEFYELVARAILPYFIGLGIVGSLVIMYSSMYFCYRYFIHTGEILVWGVRNDDKIDTIWREKFDRKGLPAGWGMALLLSAMLLLATWLSAWVWPITFLFSLPLLIMIAFGYQKRKKTAFLQKLKGQE
jgi:hypothetical protein